MSELPLELQLEVKTSRSNVVQVGTRDLEGVGPNGHVVVLLNDLRLHGPRWILVPARTLQARGYSEPELSEIAEASALADALNRGWSHWILDRESWTKLLEPGNVGIGDRVAWCRREHPPRANLTEGALREVKLADALAAFRASLDMAATGESGSQVEGQVHQALLGDVLHQAGYEVTLNPVGVPDIVAKHNGSSPPQGLAERLHEWHPESSTLRAARDALAALSPEELDETVRRLRAG